LHGPRMPRRRDRLRKYWHLQGCMMAEGAVPYAIGDPGALGKYRCGGTLGSEDGRRQRCAPPGFGDDDLACKREQSIPGCQPWPEDASPDTAAWRAALDSLARLPPADDSADIDAEPPERATDRRWALPLVPPPPLVRQPAGSHNPVLEQHIRAWLQPLRRSRLNQQQVESCIRALHGVVNKRLFRGHHFRVYAFGSAVNGFGAHGCDLDAVVCDVEDASDDEKMTQDYMQNMLYTLAQRLQNSAFTVKECVLAARVPVLRLRYKAHDVDVSINNMVPLLNTRLLQAYAALDARVVELGLTVKNWAKDKEVCGAAGGHLSSYTFTLMVIYFLQVACDPPVPCLQRDTSIFMNDFMKDTLVSAVRKSGWALHEPLSALICGFFSFYATLFRWGEEVVSIRLGRREASGHPDFRSLRGQFEQRIHIEDPIERHRNLRDVLGKEQESRLREEFRIMDQQLRLILALSSLATYEHG